MTQNLDIVGIGTGCIDVLHTNKGLIHSPGGSTANTIFALQKMGLKTGYIGRVGADENGRIFAGDLKNAGVDTSRLRISKDRTALCHIRVSGGRRKIYRHENFRPILRLTKDEKDYIRSSRMVFIRLSNILFRPVAELCTKNNVRLFVSMHEFNLDINPIDLIKGHRIEAIFSGKHRFERIGTLITNLLNNGTTLVLTKGREGCEVHSAGEIFFYKALSMEPVDSTGAGDAFAAGFIFGTTKGWNMERSCDFANFMGAMATTGFGARTQTASLEDYELFKQSGLRKLVVR